MSETVRKYRARNHRCVYCVHLDRKTPDVPFADIPWWCKAKKKSITSEAAYRLRPLCKCYEQDGGAE